MPKLKTHKGIAKRIKVTANGKLKAGKRGRRHRNSHMSGDTMRSLNQKQLIHKHKLRQLERIMGTRLHIAEDTTAKSDD
ncbi:MAG: 50S ribosomal protein L35 [Planctomycetota bacterium]